MIFAVFLCCLYDLRLVWLVGVYVRCSGVVLFCVLVGGVLSVVLSVSRGWVYCLWLLWWNSKLWLVCRRVSIDRRYVGFRYVIIYYMILYYIILRYTG